jgi:hypothetical protein
MLEKRGQEFQVFSFRALGRQYNCGMLTTLEVVAYICTFGKGRIIPGSIFLLSNGSVPIRAAIL